MTSGRVTYGTGHQPVGGGIRRSGIMMAAACAIVMLGGCDRIRGWLGPSWSHSVDHDAMNDSASYSVGIEGPEAALVFSCSSRGPQSVSMIVGFKTYIGTVSDGPRTASYRIDDAAPIKLSGVHYDKDSIALIDSAETADLAAGAARAGKIAFEATDTDGVRHVVQIRLPRSPTEIDRLFTECEDTSYTANRNAAGPAATAGSGFDFTTTQNASAIIEEAAAAASAAEKAK